MFDYLIPMLGAAVAATLIVFALSGPSGDKAAKRRIGALKERYAGAASVTTMEAQMRRITANRDTRVDSLAASILPRPALLKKRIAMTGKNWSVGNYGIASAAIVVVTALLLLTRGMPVLLALMVGLLAGLGLPHMVIGFLIKKRTGAFTAKFPDAIELLVRGLRAGLPISETLNVVANEIPGPVGEEFRQVSDKIKIGRTMDLALQDTADRLGTPEFQFFVIALAIQRETGGNLAETLANLAEVLRKRGQMKLKIKAMSSESKASAYIIGSLPFIVFVLIYFVNASYMGGFFVDQRLMIAGGGGLVWMSIGAFIMSRMIAFEI
ncbi:tight adherence protein B [Sphingomonas jejuensis]|uniref:Tight adherence protein B n=2 Tax=Sphingomonas jejuensis TaxID=904715 RepID=A0ABX0XJ71_9SPHN|nr:tight adherence protein B [Sphingomonas jejuensis]